MTTRRPRIGNEATVECPSLNLPLNNALTALAERIDKVSSVRFVKFPPFTFTSTSGFYPPSPLHVAAPGLSVVGLWIGRIENVGDTAARVEAYGLDWRLLTNGYIDIRGISGLLASTKYRVFLIGVCDA